MNICLSMITWKYLISIKTLTKQMMYDLICTSYEHLKS